MSLADSAEIDLLVIGAGPGGYVAAIRAAQLGKSVVLVDADAPGGTCLNHGCIPSKALLSATDIAYKAGQRQSMGIYADPYIDWDELLEWNQDVISQLTGGVEALCHHVGVEFIHGRAAFIDDHMARIDRNDEDDRELSFQKAIVATGSRPIELPEFPFEDDRILASRDVFSLPNVPTDLLIVGAGYIGLELATLFGKLGTDVTVIELEDNALPGWESDLRNNIREHVESLNVTFRFDELAVNCETNEDSVTITTETEDEEEFSYMAERVVVAVGREPVTDTVGLDAIGLEPMDRGFLTTDARCRTECEHVFAVGDVAGEPMLAHKASKDGLVAAETIGGKDTSTSDIVVPAVVFTDPEMATVGLSESAAEEAEYDPVVGRMSFDASGRALTADSPEGFVRVVIDAETETLLGAQVISEHASELIGELTLAVDNGLPARSIVDTTHAHPTFSEAVMEACANALGESIHVLN
jgi:dihydrolipoamide dehydrogenase